MTKHEDIKIPFTSFDSVKTKLGSLLMRAFEELSKNINLKDEELSLEDLVNILERPPESSLGDYAFPCFRFAKVLRKKPQAIAEELKGNLLSLQSSLVKEVKVVGAFLNIFISHSEVAEKFLPEIFSREYFKILSSNEKRSKTKTMIEFSQPNTHKEFHVGHGRNVCLGDSICRIYQYCGFDLIRANYLGDEGTHVAKALWEIKKAGSVPKGLSPVEFYGSCYTRASEYLRESSEEDKKNAEQEISEILANLEKQSGEDYTLWQKTRKECLDDFDSIYKWLDVSFDKVYYESEVSEESQKIVDEYVAKGLFKESEGAIGLDLEDVNLGFFMARKSDGTTPYITKDLALAQEKFRDSHIDRSIYVVGSEQKFHFEQLFEALKRMGFEQASRCYHLSYAHVVLPEGKMSSRKGNTFTFKQLISIMEEEIYKKLDRYKETWDEKEIAETAHRLSLGAIKYGMLSSDPNKEIIFDPELWTSFEGNTGPYLMYSYARTRSILTKAGTCALTLEKKSFDSLSKTEEYDLLSKMYDFNDAVRHSIEQHKPSVLAHYLYELSKCFNRFYVNVSVLKAETEDLKRARLNLLEGFSIVLKEGLRLLGITPPERM